MEAAKIISGNTEQEVWTTIEADLNNDTDILNYQAVINQGGKQIELYIDIDLGGGFEGGSELTVLSAPLKINPEFKFAVHDEDFLDSIGKFFGLEDIKTGYPNLDEHVIIKTNHEEKARTLFSNTEIRNFFTTLEDFDFGIHTRTVNDSDFEEPFLEMNINKGIINASELRQVYHIFYMVLMELDM